MIGLPGVKNIIHGNIIDNAINVIYHGHSRTYSFDNVLDGYAVWNMQNILIKIINLCHKKAKALP